LIQHSDTSLSIPTCGWKALYIKISGLRQISKLGWGLQSADSDSGLINFTKETSTQYKKTEISIREIRG
jgi:hypothetical protein